MARPSNRLQTLAALRRLTRRQVISPRHFTSSLDLRDHARARATRLPLDRHHWETPNFFRFAHHRVRQARLGEFRELLDDGEALSRDAMGARMASLSSVFPLSVSGITRWIK